MNRYVLIVIFLCTAVLSACETGKNSPRGFSLPEGDVAAGKTTFVELHCHACHATPDVEQLAVAGEDKISIQLGGEVDRVQTYADLVTSIINPSHRLARGYPKKMIKFEDKSRMPLYNDVMTVTQLTDVVTYLQPFYTLRVYERTRYKGF